MHALFTLHLDGHRIAIKMILSFIWTCQSTSLGGPSLATIRVSPRLSLDTRILLSRYTVSNLQIAVAQHNSVNPLKI